MTPKKHHPPKWADVLLSWFCSEEVIETLRGDLYELYGRRLGERGRLTAYLGFIADVISSFKPFAFKKLFRSKHSNTMSMFKNYFKVAWRNLLKHKMYSSIKIGGLSIGIAACLLISLFVLEELSHDKNYPGASRIYRLINVDKTPGEEASWTAHQPMVASMTIERFPEVENAGRLVPYDWQFAGSNQLRRKDRDQNTYEEGFAYADQPLLEILGTKMIYGNRETALANPWSIVISEEKSEKYFPGEDPVGKQLILEGNLENPWTIGGVMEDPVPENHLQFDFLLSLTEQEFWPGEQTSWCCSNYNIYVKLIDGASPQVLESKMAEMLRENYLPYLKEQGNKYAEDVEKYRGYSLQPVTDIYLYSADIYDIMKTSDIKVVYLFLAISIFILLLACINFINLSTAKSANRAKEVGLRKVVGSFRSDLVKQFLTESMVITAFSMVFGLLLAWVLMPFFNILSGKSLEMPFDQWWLYPAIFGLIIIVGVIAGLYPSFYLSAFRPIDVIRGKVSKGVKTSSLRGVMVVFQFTCSIILIVGATLVYRQMQFILHKDLGYDKEQVIMIQGTTTLGDKLELFQNKLAEVPEVMNVSVSSYLPVSGTKRDQNAFWNEGRRREDPSVGAQIWRVDDNYMETLGMRLHEGRGFEEGTLRDSTSIIINQTFARELGLEDPIGKRIENFRLWTIIGVVEDFHFETMRGKIEPLAFAVGRFGSVVPVKVKTTDMQETLESITDVWDEFMPNQPIRYSFMADVYASMYEDVERTGNVFTSFSVLAILVACLGLFGLSAFMVEQRSKEISIRKVLGASVQTIFGLLTSNFMKLILISLVIAIPSSFYLMNQWLSDFEYRVDISWVVFLFASLVISIIALLTISLESIKAATVNPVKGLRSE